MRRSLLAWYARYVVRHPLWILSIAGVLTLASLAVSLQLEMRTSREDLSDSFHVAEAAFDRYVEEFGSANTLIVIVEPRDPETIPGADEARAFVETLAGFLEARPEFFRDVFYRIDVDAMRRWGLYYVELETLRQAEKLAADALEVRGLDDANRLLARRIREGLADGTTSPAASLEGVAAALRWQADFLTDPETALDLLDESALPSSGVTGSSPISPDGYLVSGDRRRFYLLAQPSSNSSAVDFVRPLIAAARQSIAQAEAAHPTLRAGLTGMPALIDEEMAAIRRDSVLTTIVAAFGVMLLSLWAFRRARLAPLVLLALGMGVIWCAGFITLTIGYLSLITSSFAVILIGLGIDYGVHLVSQYEIECAAKRSVQEALGNAIRITGPGLLTGAGTTALAFFTLTLMEFRGFAQLGLVAGAGVILCLLSMLTVLPALLALEGKRRSHSETPRASTGPGLSRILLRFPRTVLVAGLALTLFLALAARNVRYNENLGDLLPAGAESLRLQDALRESSELSPDFGVILAANLDELRRLQEAQPDEETIGRRESILDYLPEQAGQKQAILERLRPALEAALSSAVEPVPPGRRDEGLALLETALSRVEETAFAAGQVELVVEAGDALDAVRTSRRTLRSAPDELRQRWDHGEDRLLQRLRGWREELVQMASEAPPEALDLPEGILQRLVGRSGSYLLYLYPEHNISDPAALAGFVQACRAVHAQVTGPAVLLYDHAGQISRGFRQALLLGAVLALAVLLIDFRRPGPALLAALPTGLGLVWMLGWMGLTGLEFNLANLIAAPLVLGIGLDNGVHMIHRFLREGREGMTVVLQHTGRAIVISSLTTMIGFGSLALASHRGMASLGAILFFGVGSCLATSTLLRPCLLRVLGTRGGFVR